MYTPKVVFKGMGFAEFCDLVAMSPEQTVCHESTNATVVVRMGSAREEDGFAPNEKWVVDVTRYTDGMPHTETTCPTNLYTAFEKFVREVCATPVAPEDVK